MTVDSDRDAADSDRDAVDSNRDAADGDGDAPAGDPASQGEEAISRWEWIAGAAGLIIVLGALSVTVTHALSTASPPDISVRLDSVTSGRNVYVAHFTATNGGSSPASGIDIEGTLADGGDTLVSTVTIRYIAGESAQQGGLFFPVDPATRLLRMRALGYEDP